MQTSIGTGDLTAPRLQRCAHSATLLLALMPSRYAMPSLAASHRATGRKLAISLLTNSSTCVGSCSRHAIRVAARPPHAGHAGGSRVVSSLLFNYFLSSS
ncbi:hypothetical protein VTK56DRAFT_253 [Thermocarpiscus australiensis]